MWKWPLPAHSARRRLGPDPQTGPAALEMDVLTPLAYGLSVALCLVIVLPNVPHAFAAAPGENAGILIVITPGVEHFAYFSHLERIAYGKLPPESLLDVQELYDTYFLRSEPWTAART
jgi:hypothetical protein